MRQFKGARMRNVQEKDTGFYWKIMKNGEKWYIGYVSRQVVI
jgi:heat shock protein HspQ